VHATDLEVGAKSWLVRSPWHSIWRTLHRNSVL